MKYRVAVLVLCVCFLLSGCMAVGPAIMLLGAAMPPKVLSGNQTGLTVRIKNSGQEPEAMALAEEHCGKYGSIPKVIGRNADGARQASEIIYECIAGTPSHTGSATQSVSTYALSTYDVQRLLKDKGYNPGPLDGVHGNSTTMALKQFQRDHALSETGTLDQPTVTALRAP